MRTIRRICVYCGSSSGNLPEFRRVAAEVGRELAEQGVALVFGGGRVGLMGVLADAALEREGEVIGVIPEALQLRELGHGGVTKLHVVGSMHERKQKMADLSDGFIALPGGVGTLEELFETFTWLQLGIHDKPVGLLNVSGFFDPLLEFLDHMVASGYLKREHLEWLLVGNDITRLLQQMREFSQPPVGKWVEQLTPNER